MEVIFEVNKFDENTIAQIKTSGFEIEDIYPSNGLNGTEIVAIVVALVPAVKDLILALWNKRSVSIKISNEFGSTELTAKNLEELEKKVDQYLAIIEKIRKSKVEDKDGKGNK